VRQKKIDLLQQDYHSLQLKYSDAIASSAASSQIARRSIQTSAIEVGQNRRSLFNSRPNETTSDPLLEQKLSDMVKENLRLVDQIKDQNQEISELKKKIKREVDKQEDFIQKNQILKAQMEEMEAIHCDEIEKLVRKQIEEERTHTSRFLSEANIIRETVSNNNAGLNKNLNEGDLSRSSLYEVQKIEEQGHSIVERIMLEQDKRALQQEIESLKRENVGLRNKIEGLSSLRSDSEVVQMLMRELNELKVERDINKRASGGSDYNSLLRKDLLEENERLKEANGKKTSEIEKLQKELSRTNAESDALKERFEKLERNTESQCFEIENVAFSEMTILSEENERLKAEITRLNSLLLRIQEEQNKQFKEKSDGSFETNKQLNDNFVALQESTALVSNLQSEVFGLKRKIYEKDDEIRKLKQIDGSPYFDPDLRSSEKIDSLMRENQDLKVKNVSLERDARKLNEYMDVISQKNEEIFEWRTKFEALSRKGAHKLSPKL
jgi:hypothetical protein